MSPPLTIMVVFTETPIYYRYKCFSKVKNPHIATPKAMYISTTFYLTSVHFPDLKFFSWFWLKIPIFLWFHWLGKDFKIFPNFPIGGNPAWVNSEDNWPVLLSIDFFTRNNVQCTHKLLSSSAVNMLQLRLFNVHIEHKEVKFCNCWPL